MSMYLVFNFKFETRFKQTCQIMCMKSFYSKRSRRVEFQQPSRLGVGSKYLRLFQLALAIDAQQPSRLKVA